MDPQWPPVGDGERFEPIELDPDDERTRRQQTALSAALIHTGGWMAAAIGLASAVGFWWAVVTIVVAVCSVTIVAVTMRWAYA